MSINSAGKNQQHASFKSLLKVSVVALVALLMPRSTQRHSTKTLTGLASADLEQQKKQLNQHPHTVRRDCGKKSQ